MKIIKTEKGEFEYHNNDDMMAWLKAEWKKAAAEGNDTIGIMAKHILADNPDKNAAENAAAEIRRKVLRSANEKMRSMKNG